VDHRGSAGWELVDPATVPPQIIARRSDGWSLAEARPIDPHAPVFASYRDPRGDFGVLTALDLNGRTWGTFPSGLEIAAGLGGWCVRDVDGTVRLYGREGDYRASIHLPALGLAGGWRGRSLAADDSLALCSMPQGFAAVGSDGTVAWRAAERSQITDLGVTLGGSVVLSGQHLSWYRADGKQCGTHRFDDREARRFVHDETDRAVAVTTGASATMLQHRGLGATTLVPTACPEWWGWRHGLLARRSVSLFLIDRLATLCFHADFPRRLNGVVRDGDLLVTVLNPIAVLRQTTT
jgi:hypothetical protein